jgi:excisionase family DNA binding protein
MLSNPRRKQIEPNANERPAIARIDSILNEAEDAERPALRLVSAHGEEVELPESVVRLLRGAVHDLAQGRAITLVSGEQELTTQQAADILNVSRPYLIKLLDQGDIPYTMTGSHRRVRLDDLMSYKQIRDRERREALDRLVRISEEFGLYDLPMEPVD